jgi:hypothetical protein
MDNILLNRTDDIDYLLQQAEALNVDVRMQDGKIKLSALKKTPATSGIIQKIGQQVKQNRKLVEYALTKKGWPDVFNPPSLSDRVSGMIPSTGAGKGAMAAQVGMDMIAPEAGIPLQLGASLLGGIGGGLLNKEPIIGAAETGAISGATNAAFKPAVKGSKWLAQKFHLPSILDKADMSRIGTVVKDALEQYGIDISKLAVNPNEFGQNGKTTVIRWLNGKEANDQVGKIFNETKKTVIDEVVKDAKKNHSQLVTNFEQKFGFNPLKKPPKGTKVSKAALSAMNNIKEAAEYARQVGPDMYKAMDEIGGLGRSVYDESGELKNSYSAFKGAKSRRGLMDEIDEKIRTADPSGKLSQMLESTRDMYSKFQGFQDFVNTDNALQKNGQWFNSQVLQKAVDGQTNPAIRFIQRRLKDAFDPLYNAVRRGAEDFTPKGTPIIADKPLLDTDKIRAVGSTPGLRSRIATAIPVPRMFGHYIGDTGMKPMAQQATQHLPVLLNSPVTKLTETPVVSDENE